MRSPIRLSESVFNKGPKSKKVEKGIAFPTCLSINHCAGHFSPSSDDTTALQDGDLVKIDLGCHIDGYIATVAHSLVVGDGPILGSKADVLMAAYNGLEAALRTLRPGKTPSDVAQVLAEVAAAYDVNVVEGVLSHQMKRYIIDGNKVVLNKPTPEMRVEDEEFEENEVYAVDVVMSTGEGKTKMLDERLTTVYKRALDQEYSLKLKASRAVFSEINKRFPAMPFTTRALSSIQGMRLGLSECVNHDLLLAYPVLWEKPNELVAQFKSTVLLVSNGSDKVTGHPVQEFKTDKQIEDESLKALLSTALKKKKGGGKKKKSKGTVPMDQA
eukprot:scaffold739_cov295-Pavlova_lutheri.AAC.7